MPLLIAIFVVLAWAAPAAAGTGRVALSVGLPAPASNVDASGASAAAALPDGGAVLVGDEPGRGLVAAALRGDGSPDPGFGTRGVSHVRVLGGRFMTLSLLRRPDGRLLVVGTLPERRRLELRQLVVVGLTATGELDGAFGVGGVARPGLEGSCGGLCDPAALAPDGSLVLTGSTGAVSPDVDHDPNAPDSFAWTVTRLTPTGDVDPGFGLRPVQGTRPGRGFGFGAAVGHDGRITLLGAQHDRSTAVRLRPDGSADPSFAGGAPAMLPVRFALDMVVGSDASVTALGVGAVARLTGSGNVDPAFGEGGVVRVDGAFARLLGTPEGVLVYRPETVEPRPSSRPALEVVRLDRAGERSRARVHLPFGGGTASFLGARRRILPPAGLRQNGFRAARLLQRPDGSYLAVGGVTVVQYSGEGEGRSTARFAAAGLTSAFGPDRRFGPPRASAKVGVSLVAQRARSSRHLRGIAVRIRASGAGLAFIRVRDRRGRTIAHGVEPVFRAGARRVRVPLLPAGDRALRRRDVRVRVSATFRDVVANRAAARRATGRLR